MNHPNESVTVRIIVNTSREKVWQLWTTPQHIMQWNNINDDWHTSYVENSPHVRGRFLFKMGLKDGSLSFDHKGIYNVVLKYRTIAYTLDDNRTSVITFSGTDSVTITETFEPDPAQPIEMQRDFCQAILNNFKRYAENIQHHVI